MRPPHSARDSASTCDIRMRPDQCARPHRQRLRDRVDLATAELIDIVAFHVVELLEYDRCLGLVAVLTNADVAQDRVDGV
jgi:hypothetical protein